MKKRLLGIFLLILCLAVMLCFVACDNNTTQSSGGTTESSTPSSENNGNNTDNSQPPREMVTIKFNTDRAHGGLVIDDQQVYVGGLITEPSETPYRRDFVFYGWCVDGDKSQKWNFNIDVVTEGMTLVAVFERQSTTDTCEHNYIIDQTKSYGPTCERNGVRVENCTLCGATKRTYHSDDATLKRKEHLEEEEIVEPTCAVDGYKIVYCPNGCGLRSTTVLKATGKHQYDDTKWYASVKPTLYVDGVYENACIVCGGAYITKTAGKNIDDEPELLFDEKVDISYLYTGGSYINEKFVNVAKYGRVLVSSFFDGTNGYHIIDANEKTFWSADTYVDGADYTADWFEVELAREYEVGALRIIMPNYTEWGLGEECYVSYDLEYWDSDANTWVSLGTISDKDAVSIGISCEIMLEMPKPIETNKIRARVTHATRYTPATIYELEAFAKVDAVERVPLNASGQANVTVSGKYNDWASGGAALVDNASSSYWYTDGRYNKTPWAMLEFSDEKYIACVQFSVAATTNRTFLLEIYADGEWSEFGTYVVPDKDADGNPVVTGNIISNKNGVCIFSVDIEKKISKMRFTITREPEYWSSYVYEITPYTIIENAFMEPVVMECSHQNPLIGDVVAPTCDKPGYTIMNCVCGEKIKTQATDILGHDFGKYTVQTAATATSFGTKVSTCRNEGCGATSTITYEEKYDAAVATPYLHNAPAAWAMTFDDGNYLDTYEWVIPQLEKYGYRATTVMSITYTDSLVETWQKYFDRGVFDLGSHSYNHTSSYASVASPSTLLGEVVNAQYWFRHNYKGQYLLGFAAPLGATSDSVAKYLTGPLAANRNGGDTNRFYNLIDNLDGGRLVWGDLNSYISKADQTEGIYVYVPKNGGTYKKIETSVDTGKTDKEGNPIFETVVSYEWQAKGSYDSKGNYIDNKSGTHAILQNANGEYVLAQVGVNYVFIDSLMTFVDVMSDSAYEQYKNGTYYYVAQDWRYDFKEEGSFKQEGGEYVFLSDNSGDYKLLKTTVGSYEKGVEQLVSLKGYTVECLHSLGSGSIYSSYNSTISKFEHLKKFGVWVGSYNDLIRYLKEYQSARIETLERTDTSVTISVTDSLDNYMYCHALTVKVDIPDSWETVTVMQGDKEIPLVSAEHYSQSGNMTEISCAIMDGYLYVDVIPDEGNVVITLGEKNENADYSEKVTITYEPFQGKLNWNEYEVRVVSGTAYASHPEIDLHGYYFRGWYLDEDCTVAVTDDYIYAQDTTLYAKLEEMPKCTDGSYNHSWSTWLPGADSDSRTCYKCGATETRENGSN